jgi:hypothetical protein
MGIELLLNSYFLNRRVSIVCEELRIAVFADSQRRKTDALYDLKIAIHGNSCIVQTSLYSNIKSAGPRQVSCLRLPRQKNCFHSEKRCVTQPPLGPANISSERRALSSCWSAHLYPPAVLHLMQ